MQLSPLSKLRAGRACGDAAAKQKLADPADDLNSTSSPSHHTQETPPTVRPATVEEIAKGPRVEASSLPGRRVIGDTHFCGTEHELHDNDVIHGPSVPLVVTKTDIALTTTTAKTTSRCVAASTTRA